MLLGPRVDLSGPDVRITDEEKKGADIDDEGVGDNDNNAKSISIKHQDDHYLEKQVSKRAM